MAVASDTQHLEKLRTYWKRHPAFPSMAKLCDVVGLSSTASEFELVNRLKDEGFIQRVEGRIAVISCCRLTWSCCSCWSMRSISPITAASSFATHIRPEGVRCLMLRRLFVQRLQRQGCAPPPLEGAPAVLHWEFFH